MKMQAKSLSRYKKRSLLLILFVVSSLFSFSQKIEPISGNNSLPSQMIVTKTGAHDSTGKKIYSPKKAALQSAILPGLGQIYNKKYWKLPIIYGAMGTSAGIFVYNLTWYKRTRFAYKVLVTKDTSNFPNVHPALQFLIDRNDVSGLQFARDQYRRDIDYSALFFIVLWGLNVVDAAVDAHLSSFDISPNLNLKLSSSILNGQYASLTFSYRIGNK